MADKSAIEWTDATWNPVTGCTKITRGCDFCYAERVSPSAGEAYRTPLLDRLRSHASA